MSDVLEKYRVVVESVQGALWLSLEKHYQGSETWGESWDTVSLGGFANAQWRIRGGYTVPSMWFKPLEERIRIAVGYAVDVVKAELAKTNAKDKADALAQEWTDKAMAMFKDAVKEL